MRLKSLIKKLTVLILLLSFNAWSNNEPYLALLAKLNQLLNDKQYSQAFQLADENTFEYGGSAEFDLLTGFAAYGSEQYQEAVFAFERVVITKPGSFLARYYLAQSYQQVDNLPAAINELEKLSSRPLTQNQLDKTQALLQRINKKLIDRKKSWYQMVSANIGYDSNVNSGSSEDRITLPNIGEIELFDSSKATQDINYNLSYLAGYQYPLSQSNWLKIDVSAHHFGYFQHSEYQRQQVAINGSYVHELLKGQLSVSGYSRPLWLEQEADIDTESATIGSVEREIALYRTENGLSIYFQKDTSKKTGYRLGGNYSSVINDKNADLDFTRIKVSGAFQYKTKQLHTVMLHWQQDSSDNSAFAYNDKANTGLTYQLTWPLTNTLVSNSYLMLENQQYDAVHPLFLKQRDETVTAFSSQLLFNSSPQLQIKLFLNVQHKSSNVPLFNYDRAELGAGWQYSF